MTTPHNCLKRFAGFARVFPVSLPDRARMGMGDLVAGDFRRAMQVVDDRQATDGAILAALAPFALEGWDIPRKYYNHDWGTTGLRVGDFIDASEVGKHWTYSVSRETESRFT